MKKTLKLLPLVVLTIGLLGSCSKIEERVDELENRIDSIESEKLVTIDRQIDGIEASIADLGAIRKTILDLISESEKQEEDISSLKEADTIISNRIDELKVYLDGKLKNFASTEWVEATFATLEQYKATDTALSILGKRLDDCYESLTDEINSYKRTLEDWQDALEETIKALSDRVEALEAMVQSVVFVPTFDDGNATYSYKDTTLLKLDYMISPASVAKTLNPGNATLLVNTLKTRAGNISVSFDVSEIVEKDAANGIYTFVTPVSYDLISAIENGAVSVSLKIAKDNTDIRSDFVKIVAETPKIEDLTNLFEQQYFNTQGWNGEGTIRLYYGCYPGMDSSKYLTGWVNTMRGAYHENSSSMYDNYPWIIYYNAVRAANLILNYVEHVSPDSEKNRYLKAQSLTFRSYCFFQLSQLYCYRWQDSDNGNSRGIILRTKELGVKKNYNNQEMQDEFEGMFGDETDHAASTLKETYEQIFSDLDEAISLFGSSSILRSQEKNYEPNIDVAHAIYAHAAISKEDWALAAEHAAKARENYSIMTNEEYKAGFSTVNREWIWSTPGYNNLYYYSYLAYVASNATASQVRYYPLLISKQLIDQIPDTDIRRGLYYIPQVGDKFNQNSGEVTAQTTKDRVWTDFAFGFPEAHSTFKIFAYMQFKIRLADPARQNPGIGPICLFRAADMYYLEAEAEYHLGNESRAQEILVMLTEPRNPSYTTCTKTGEDLLNEIKLYRRFDCWAEGFDWFDCKRWGGDYKRLGYQNGGNFFSKVSGDFPDAGKTVTVLGKGVRWAGCSFGLCNDWGGLKDDEWGSHEKIRKPTRIDRAEIIAELSDAQKAVISFVIYQVDGKDNYIPMQHVPVYQTILDSDGKKNLVFEEPETLILEPGQYYFAIRFVEFVGKGSFNCLGYFKNAYDRNDNFKMPLSIGLKVTGTEYGR